MTVFVVPPPGEPAWPTLGPDIVAWMEAMLVHGPGDLRGRPYRVDDEDRAIVYAAYEVAPPSHVNPCGFDDPLGRCSIGDGSCGRRRFARVGISRRKGTAKTELLAALVAVELAPDGPVRCDGFRHHRSGLVPVGRPVTDPYIPLVAYTEEQSDDLAYAALLVMLGEGPAASSFDIGLERVIRKGGDGKAVSLAGSPNARDGARTTFAGLDETHRWASTRLRGAHRTVLANLAKRIAADPWACEVTTRQEPGIGSVAEQTEDYARAIARGTVKDPRLFFYLREASDRHDLDTRTGLRTAITEATAPSKRAWTNVPAILALFQDPRADHAYLERVWMNRLVRGASRAFDAVRWAELAVKRAKVVPEGARVVAGFDGSRFRDATAIVATELASGYQWVVGIWERPPNLPDNAEWEVPTVEVEAAITHLFERWDVVRMYCDPPYWEGPIAEWSGRFGKERVTSWWTNRTHAMSYSLRAYATAIRQGDLSHDGHPVFAAHVANAVRVDTGRMDDEGPLFTISKDRDNSPNKIDCAMAATLSWEARNDAIAAGAREETAPSVYEERGLIALG